jgi:APA family basic amino acid/polyamine antiporter
MALLIIISTFGCNNGLILQGARLFYTMAKEGLFFRSAATLNRNGVPGTALWLQALWASVLCLSGSYGDLLYYCTFASLILRRTEPLTERPYRVTGYPYIPALYILIAGAICIDLLLFKTRNAGLGLLIMALGLPVYYLFHPKNDNKTTT